MSGRTQLSVNETGKKLRTMDRILAILGAFLLLFTVTMIVIYVRTGGIPDTLCGCVFACCGTEAGAMAWIKNVKEQLRQREWELEDREELKDV